MSSPYAPLPGQPYPAGVPGQEPRTAPKAVVGLVLAIAAYLPVVPFVGAIAALVLAGIARREILASGGALTGLGLVTVTRVLAWLHLVFVALLVLLLIAAFVGLFTFSLFGVRVG